MANKTLTNAMTAKEDEFYTQLSDIEDELRHYTSHFKGKTVYCNCDDPFESNFTLYFLMNFNRLGLKRLISTGYATSSIMGQKLKVDGAYCLDVKDTKHAFIGSQTDLNAMDAQIMLASEPEQIRILTGDEKYPAGDFRSQESIDLLKQCDIVVGNPPFSLFAEYITQLEAYQKKYCIIGSINAFTYQEVYPLIQSGKVWVGTRGLNKDMYFDVPDKRKKWLVDNKKEGSAYKIINGIVYGRLASACWLTNMDYVERHQTLRLGCVYKGYEKDYPQYDNYNAIDVGKINSKGVRVGDNSKIPYDYDGVMGVSITFLDKFCPEQFEIIGMAKTPIGSHLRTKIYDRQIQYNKNGTTQIVTKLNDGPSLYSDCVPSKFPYYEVDGKYYISLYPRFLIRNRYPGRCDWDSWDRELASIAKGE